MLGYRDGIAILEIILYTIFFPLSLFLCLRHGFGKSSGWYFLIIFTLVRLIGGILQLVGSQAHSSGAIVGAVVTNGVGLSPLNLMLLGLLNRVNDHTAPSSGKLPVKIFRLITLVSLVGLILNAYGGSSSKYDESTGSLEIQISTLAKAGLIIYLVVFVAQVFLNAYFFAISRYIEAGEKRLVLAVAVASPFMVIRYAYSLRYTFTGDVKWNPVFGSPTLFLVLSVIMEVIVVAVCLVIGLTLRKTPVGVVEQEELDERTEQGVNMRRNRAQEKRKQANGPIGWLYYAIKGLIEDRKTQPVRSMPVRGQETGVKYGQESYR